MRIAMLGLGKMGMGMARRLLQHNHQVVAFDLNSDAVHDAVGAGATGATSLQEVVTLLDSQPRVLWMMLPAGPPTEHTVNELAGMLGNGDIVIDGGNSNYKESILRANMLAERGIRMLDTGVSGGIWGEREGFNLMTGGERFAFDQIVPILEALAPPNGYMYVGPNGSGHFVKMVHNGIEYGMMQAIAEGFELMAAKTEFEIDLASLSRLWQNGSVVRSWLLELTGNVLEEDHDLSEVAPYVPDSGEGRWTVEESIDLRVPLPVITLALQMRFRSRQDDSYAARMLAALRNQFGGHAIKRKDA